MLARVPQSPWLFDVIFIDKERSNRAAYDSFLHARLSGSLLFSHHLFSCRSSLKLNVTQNICMHVFTSALKLTIKLILTLNLHHSLLCNAGFALDCFSLPRWYWKQHAPLAVFWTQRPAGQFQSYSDADGPNVSWFRSHTQLLDLNMIYVTTEK